jgi:hypothetical protein
MADPILDKASFQLVRTNPKLTTNVKLVVDSSDKLYLDSFNANVDLSNNIYKAFNIDPNSSYEKDVFKFYSQRNLPSSIAYSLFQKNNDISVLPTYDDQYETFYAGGAESIASDSYSEDLGILAPIWLEEQIPDYFVIFRTNGPANINLVNKSSSDYEIEYATGSSRFSQDILENSTLIKTFDLTENSNIGKYLRNYRSNPLFPQSSLFVSNLADEPMLFRGISYEKGGFVEKGDLLFNTLSKQEKTIIETEYLISSGFERNGVICANLINLQFLFNDEYADEYSINRYFGIYVSSQTEGSFNLDSNAFYLNRLAEKQYPRITSSDQISNLKDEKFVVSNTNGVVLYADPNSIETDTGFPNPQRISEVDSFLYVKDKYDSFHTLKKGSTFPQNALRLSDLKADLGAFTGLDILPASSIETERLSSKGASGFYIQINSGTVRNGLSIEFYDGNTKTHTISCNSTVATTPGKSNQYYFNGNGSSVDIANSILGAINFYSIDTRFFSACIVENKVVVYSRFTGSRFNRLGFKVTEVDSTITTYPSNITDQLTSFIGGSNESDSRIKVIRSSKDRFIGNLYKAGENIASYVSDGLYLEEPVFNSNGNVISFSNIDVYSTVIFDKPGVEISTTGTVSSYTNFKPEFGRLCIFPVRDFDFDFYSEQYSQMGELAEEHDFYNEYVLENGVLVPVEESSYPQIVNFYENGGFSELQPILKNEGELDIQQTQEILSEYDRLFENYNKNLALPSRTVPYVCKWVYDEYGKDVRQKAYRLNYSPAFGIYNFSPSDKDFTQNAQAFTHEWYYLSKVPSYFDQLSLLESWSYFNETVNDNQGLIPGFFQNVETDNFTNYFVVDNLHNDLYDAYFDKQIRYSRFREGNSANFAEAFFRGVKVIGKKRAESIVDVDYNLNDIKFTDPAYFNDYKFAAILIPNRPDKPDTQIKIIENKKWKTITLAIFLTVDYQEILPGRDLDVIDRTLLYCLKDKISPDGAGDFVPQTSGGDYLYEDSIMNGAISFASSKFNTAGQYYIIKGTFSSGGVSPNFTQDIKLGPDGKYNDIEFTIESGPDAGFYQISGITDVVNSSTLYATLVTKNGSPFNLPYVPFDILGFTSATYYVVYGGFNTFTPIMDSVSFASISAAINNGDPKVIYESVETDGTLNYDQFVLELRSQDFFMKSVYLNPIKDPNKPTSFNLQNIIGYELSVSDNSRVIPFFRHGGRFNPKFVDVFKFLDPYLAEETDNTATQGSSDLIYKQKVFDLMRYKNTQLDPSFVYFGKMRNYFYHKVNSVNSGGILELSGTSSFQSLYPLIDEIAISKREFYIFSSSWDPGYFVTNLTKSKTELAPGTYSSLEKKSFAGSKYIKVPQSFIVEEFLSSEYTIKEEANKVSVYLNVQAAMVRYFYQKISSLFERYVNPNFTLFSHNSVKEYTESYIKKNIIPLYNVGDIELYIKESRLVQPDDFTPLEIPNVDKISQGLRPVKNFTVNFKDPSQFNLDLIYIKKSGFSISLGSSLIITKK